MNPRDDNALADQLSARLADFDEALAAGLPVSPLETETLPEELVHRLRRAQAVLRRLEADRRHSLPLVVHPSTPPGPARNFSFDPLTGTGQLGRFRLLRELGRGGHALVFLAHDPVLGREVALKIPRPEVLLEPALCNRFQHEARAAAALDHPHIVPVFESGEAAGVFYIASAYCPGINLAEWLRQQDHPVPVSTAAALVATLAEAVHYIHERGVLHRDLKPSNVLLTGPAPPPPAGTGCAWERRGLEELIPRLTDFGLSRFLQAEQALTRSGAILGTLAYMAPEQAEGRLRDITTATDVYALGAILYEVLTGRTPFAGSADVETLRRVAQEEPTPPSRWRPDLSRDLEAVCLQCLEKKSQRRYASAGELAADLRRFLAGEPTRARPLSPQARLMKWARRRPLAATLFVVATLTLLTALAAAGEHFRQLHQYAEALEASAQREREQALDADRLRGLAEEKARLARQQAYATSIRLADGLLREGNPGLMNELLNELRPAPGEEDLRGFAWYFLRASGRRLRHLRGHSRAVDAVAFLAHGRRWVSASRDDTLKLWDPASERLLASYPVQRNEHEVKFSADGTRLLAVVALDGTHHEVRVWDTATGTLLARRTLHCRYVSALAPDGSALALACPAEKPDEGGQRVLLWDLSTGRERFLPSHPFGNINQLRFSPDGHTLAIDHTSHPTGAAEGVNQVRLFDLVTAQEKVSFVRSGTCAASLVFTPDGQGLAVLTWGIPWVILLDLASGQERVHLEGFSDPLSGAAFTPDGRTLAVATQAETAGSVSLWDAQSGKPCGEPLRLACGARSVSFAPDGQTLAVGCGDGLVRLWRPVDVPSTVALPGHRPDEAWAVAFAPNGQTLASAGDDHLVRLWDVAAESQRTVLRGHGSLVSCLAFAPDGRLLASGSYDDTVKLWDTVTGTERATLVAHGDDLRCLAFSPDGKVLASGGRDRCVRLWDTARHQPLAAFPGHTDEIRGLAFAPDGRTLASVAGDGKVRVWDLATGQARHVLEHSPGAWCVAFSPDGKTLASGGWDGVVRFWETDTGRELGALRGHQRGIRSLAFTPDGKSLATGGLDKTVRLHHIATGHELLTWGPLEHEVNSLAFSADGCRLAAALHDGTVRLWNAPAADAGP